MQRFGPNSRQATNGKDKLADLLVRAERFDEAEVLLLEVLEERRQHEGRSTFHELATLSELGKLHYLQREFRVASDYFEESWRGLEQLLGPEAPQALSAGRSHAFALMKLGEDDRGLSVLETVLERRAAAGFVDEPEYLRDLATLVDSLEQAGDSERGRSLLRRAIDAARERGRSKPLEFVRLLYRDARYARIDDEPERALEVLAEGLTLLETIAVTEPTLPGCLWRETGLSRSKLGQHEAASEALAAAFDEFERHHPPGSRHISNVASELAAEYEQLGRTREAARWRAKAKPE